MMPNLRARSVVAAAVLTPALLPPTRLSLCADAQPSPLDIPFPASLSEMSALQLQLTGVSGFTGYTAGYALKRTFRVFVFTTGVIFMGLQTLAHNQLITIHWDKMEEKFHAAVDLDQDGKLYAGRKLEQSACAFVI